ncbi:hypothetical protein KCP71_04325 [Salmonella enterica subsp. enterica]|nr:hypothetical protein KCP71_04325 [Salmonella enterica subsp. enterica]
MCFSLFRYPASEGCMKNVGIYRLRRAAPKGIVKQKIMRGALARYDVYSVSHRRFGCVHRVNHRA